MSHIFISYSRRDVDFAQKIVTALAANNLDTWIDWKSIPKGEDWEQEIYRGIEEADAFLFLISPDSVVSPMCNKEIDHAVKNGKRILPIVIRDADRKIIHPEISKRNWIFCRDGQDDFTKAIEETRKTIHTDYEWLKYHTELQVKALKWEQKKDASRLLRGKELREAEKQLAEISSQEDPQPTKLQREYILVSRRNEEQQRRQTTIGLSLGLVIMAVLAAFAWGQRTDAMKRARIARARELVATSLTIPDSSPQLRLLLSIGAFNTLQSSDLPNLLSETNLRNHLVNMGGVVLRGHTGFVANLAFSPNGNILISRSVDDTIRIWKLDDLSNQPLVVKNTGSFIGHIDFSGSEFNLSPDGSWLAFNNNEGQTGLLDLENLTSALEPIYVQSFSSMAFSPDSHWLAGDDGRGTIAILNIQNLSDEPILLHNSDTDTSNSNLAFSPEGNWLAVGGGNGNVNLWDMSNMSLQAVHPGQCQGVVDYVKFSPDERWLAMGADSIICLWDLNKLESDPMSLRGHDSDDLIEHLTFSPDGKYLASSGFNYSGINTVRLWNMNDLGSSYVVQNHRSRILNLSFSPDGKWLAAGDADAKIFVSGFENPSFGSFTDDPKILLGCDGAVYSIEFSQDSRWLAAGGDNGDVRLWDMQNPYIEPILFSSLSFYDNNLAFTPDGRQLAFNTEKNTIIYDLSNLSAPPILWPNLGIFSFSQDGTWVASMGEDMVYLRKTSKISDQPLVLKDPNEIHFWPVPLAFSPNGNWLVSRSIDKKVSLWGLIDPSFSKVIRLTGHNQLPDALAFSSDNKWLASGGGEGIDVWHLENISEDQLPINISSEYVYSLIFSPDGQWLVSGGGTVTLWNSKDNFSSPKILHGPDMSNHLAFSPDGHWLASGAEDGTANIYFWNMKIFDNSPVILQGPYQNIPRDGIDALAFSPDGRYFATIIFGRAFLWTMDMKVVIQKACQVVGRNFTRAEWQQYFPGEPYRITCSQWPAGE